ncbi:TonB-dependent receptor [Telluria sp. Tellsp104]
MHQKYYTVPRMTLVALALSQAFAMQAMAQVAPADANTVVVTGIRASAQSSVAIKKNTMEIVDSISAEDIGKLPDANVAETMTRVPGVTGYRYGGEAASPAGNGSGLTIRGLSGLTSAQLNGRSYFTAGSREFNIEDAIPGMIAGVDVYKNPSAEHVEGGIGGLVNIRTRKSSDFKKFTAQFNAGVNYNDLEKKYDPDLFGLVANRFNLGGGSSFGVLAGVAYQRTAGRSDSMLANRGPDLRRIVRADSAEYAKLAAANTSNNPALPLSSYVGKSDVSFLAPVATLPVKGNVGPNMPDPTGLTADEMSNIITTPGVFTNLFQESIHRQRKGLNLAADYVVDNTLRFYTEANSTEYLYHQKYRFIWIDQGVNGGSGNVRNLQTAPFALTEGLANRNLNGGSDDVLSTKRFQSGTFLNTQLRNWGGDEHSPYKTWNVAGGAEWRPTPALSLKADLSYLKATRTQDNRRVEFAGAAGTAWDVNRVADGEPQQLGISGPSVSDPSNFVFNWYNNAPNQSWNDKGKAAVLSGAFTPEDGFISRLSFGVRYASQEDQYRNFGFGRPLTTDGKPLAADRSNAIPVSGKAGNTVLGPTDWMQGKTGFTSPYVVYNPDLLLGNQVRDQFPSANIPAEGSWAEALDQRRGYKESTTAGWLSADFNALDERIKGNVGVRVVRTDLTAYTNLLDPTTAPPTLSTQTKSNSYTNVLPTLNVSYDIMKDFLVRFGYGRGITRPDPGLINPNIDRGNAGIGVLKLGNPNLRPQVADSFDVSFERYFNATNYTSVALFRKNIDGFFNAVNSCQSVPFTPAYTGATLNGCDAGKWNVSQQVNADKGWVKGVEVAGQWFFDSSAGWLDHFGVSGSYTYLDSANPVNIGTVTEPHVITTQQPALSKNSYSISGLYEDNKLSARLVYTWRSSNSPWGFGASPMANTYTPAYGILDGSLNYAVDDHMTLSFNARNLTNKAPLRFSGEALTYETGRDSQHFINGRGFGLSMRYKF